MKKLIKLLAVLGLMGVLALPAAAQEEPDDPPTEAAALHASCSFTTRDPRVEFVAGSHRWKYTAYGSCVPFVGQALSTWRLVVRIQAWKPGYGWVTYSRPVNDRTGSCGGSGTSCTFPQPGLSPWEPGERWYYDQCDWGDTSTSYRTKAKYVLNGFQLGTGATWKDIQYRYDTSPVSWPCGYLEP